MKMKVTITAQRLFMLETRRSFFGRTEYLYLSGTHADVSILRGNRVVHTERFSGKLGGPDHTSPYARTVEVDIPASDEPLTVFATSPGIFTYRFDLQPVFAQENGHARGP